MTRLTYPNYSNHCGWNAMLPKRRPRPALSRDTTVDFAVIGAGYTGLAIARRLHELNPDARIAIVEATTIGEGSSARNSGFTSAHVLPRTASMEMAEKARIQSAFFSEAFEQLKRIIRDNNIDCDLHQVGSIRAAATEAGEASLRRVVEVAVANQIPHTVLGREDISRRIGSPYYRFGIHIQDTWLLQPAALIRGLADALPASIEFYEETPVKRLRREDGWLLETSGGVLRCKSLALANNGFIPKFGYLKSRMATIYTYAAVTEAIGDDRLGEIGEAESWGLLPPHRLGTTLRRIGRNRVMVRSLYSLESEIEEKRATRELRRRFERRWPKLSDVQFEYLWGGTTAFTMNGSPWWGKLDQGLYASGGCNGSGITKGTMLGGHLAELMLGKGDHDRMMKSMGGASWIAPEPLRSIGFQIVSALESRKAGLEM
ncbi:NAD(P)/FAD-dependent oxidoreductase [Taklimakanibacter lacteus]|uniref:NAD(P)/FAD-dependent oxidoreductase n=1 Tax=Taklimakanibacter lacteus TaxID=2268456 RepID=UPI000E667EE9